MSPLRRVVRAFVSRRHRLCYYQPIIEGKAEAALFLILPSRLSWIKRSCLFSMSGLPFITRRQDLVAVEEIALRGEYDFLKIMHFRDGAYVLDLGANIGLFALAVYAIYPSARVYSFEPSNDTFRQLSRNRQINSSLNWHVFSQAIWKITTTLRFDTAKISTTRRILKDSNGGEPVAATTISRIFEQYLPQAERVDCCKIDIEGAELAALGADPRVMEKIDNLIIELHPAQCDAKAVLSMIKKVYKHLYEVTDRDCDKPLLVASHLELPLANSKLKKLNNDSNLQGV